MISNSKKLIFIFLLFFLSLIYTFPNFYGEKPSIVVDNLSFNEKIFNSIKKKIDDININLYSFDFKNSKLVIKFNSTQDQFKAYELLKKDSLLNLSLNILNSKDYKFFNFIRAKPMKMGLDLRGGVYLLVKVKANDNIKSNIRLNVINLIKFLKDSNFDYKKIKITKNNFVIINFFIDTDKINSNILNYFYLNFECIKYNKKLILKLKKTDIIKIINQVIYQTIFIFNKRINELGISDSIVYRQGKSNVVVEIAGIQDINRAKSILGKIAILKFMLVDDKKSSQSKIFYKDGNKIYLKNKIILTGKSIIYATSGFDNVFNKPCVNVKLSNKDAKVFKNITKKNIGKSIAIIYEEVINSVGNKNESKEKIISVATIMSELSNEFQITGLNIQESKDLALLLRSGSLPSSVLIIEENLIGPTLGEDNIKNGFFCVIFSFFSILFFMILRYKKLGLIACLGLFFNLVFLLSIMSIINVTLTLPGLAGIAVTIGMSIDGNILIFERIKEEFKKNNNTFLNIESGFRGAYSSIVDSNLTTLIVGISLFIFGNGPIKGFAITLSIGILTSMYASIFVTKTFIDFIRIKKIKIL